MSREVCKYYLHGACRNGASCRFVHSTDAPKSSVCTFYLQGNCAYGDRCRYDHVRPQVRTRHHKTPRKQHKRDPIDVARFPGFTAHA